MTQNDESRTENSGLTRRKLLRTTGGIGAATAIGGSAVPALAQDDGGGTGTGNLYTTCWEANVVVVTKADAKLPKSVKDTTHIKVGKAPLYISGGVGGQSFFVTNAESGDVSVINPEKKEETERIPVGQQPRGVGVSADRQYAFVANRGENTVAVIDTQKLAVQTTIDVGENPHDVVFSPDGTQAYVTNHGSDTVGVIDVERLKMTSTIKVADGPRTIALNAERNRLYTTNTVSNDLGVVDTEQGKLLGTRPLTDGPADVALTPDGSKAYATGMRAGTVVVYEAASGNDGGGSGPSYELSNIITVNDSLKEIPVESHEAYTAGPYGITVGPNGKLAYAAFLGNNQVVTIDTETDEVVDRMSTPAPYAFAIRHDAEARETTTTNATTAKTTGETTTRSG
ncbi:YncE family protein [Halorussus sp. MSC15.2]|uniref:YncE family protein n=1 Tax=Halorussus sp. MSC15.2 TaxID=2283638 RepID=UPI0013D65497|nr:YncE family protein [Halorussus sp. MSC15.2]NEU57644.1 YncE family protein [Halorussus sp. MSC15.2]